MSVINRVLGRSALFAGNYKAVSGRQLCTDKLQTRLNESSAPNFEDHRHIFKEHSSTELVRALLVLQTCAIDPLVNNSYKLLTLGERILGERLLSALVSPYYNQFVAGNTDLHLQRVCDKLHRKGVNLMVAPSLEADTDQRKGNDVFVHNLKRMVWLMKLTAGNIRPSTTIPPICQAKVTGHCSPHILEQISSQYSKMNLEERCKAVHAVADIMAGVTLNNEDYKEITENRIPTKLVTSVESQITRLANNVLPFSLNKNDLKDFIAAMQRMALFGILADKWDVVIAVDAEYTCTNPAINLVALALMVRHNRTRPLIWNTYQAYLKGTADWLSEDSSLAEKLGTCFGVKLVRGAYLEHERQEALLNNMEDPVNESYEVTNNNYNRLAKQEIRKVHENPAKRALLIATHNEDSVRRALQLMATLPTLDESQTHHCAFGQVFGMAENISIPLASSGAVVYKSVPMGSVSEVLPYLARRANENRVVLKGARKERSLLAREIRDRVLRSFKGNSN